MTIFSKKSKNQWIISKISSHNYRNIFRKNQGID